MNAMLIAMGLVFAGYCIGSGIESLGSDVKAGLESLADALREIEE